MSKLSPNEPWLHKASGFWCKKVSGELLYLDRDRTVAKRKLSRLLRDRERQESGDRDWLQAPFSELCDVYLDEVKGAREPATYEGYRYRLLRALKILGPHLRVGQVKRGHLKKIETELRKLDRSPTTIRDTLATVQNVFRWAVVCEWISHDPSVGLEKPKARRRTRVVTRKEFAALLQASNRNRPFQRVLLALRKTGCRPGEIRKLTWEMVDLDRRLWILPEHKTVTTQATPKPRIIPLPDSIWRMCRRLKERQPESSYVFVNAWGNPYSKDRLVKTMSRVRDRAGIEVKAGEQIVLYSERHTYASDAYGKIGDIALAELMGHTDIQMTRRYAHLNTDQLHEYQRAVQKRNPTRGSA